MNPTGLRFLRPYLHSEVSVSCKSAYIRFFNSTTQRLFSSHNNHGHTADVGTSSVDVKVPFQVQQRVHDLNKAGALNWPRIKSSSSKSTTIEIFNKEFVHIKPGEEVKEVVRTLRGGWFWQGNLSSADRVQDECGTYVALAKDLRSLT